MSNKALDAIDVKILSILQSHGRITKTALAEKVNLSPTPCWERLKRLESEGYIDSYHAKLSTKAISSHTVILTEITLHKHTHQDFNNFEREIQNYEQITDCWATGGGIDYIVKFSTKSIEEYQRLIEKLLAADLGIDRYYTYIVTKPVKQSIGFPTSFIK